MAGDAVLRRIGVRPRIAAFAAVIVGVALTVGALLLVGVLRSRLDDAATTAAQLRARDVAALAEAGTLPRRLALPGEESAFVQVTDDEGRVAASTENIEGEPAVSTQRPAGSEPLLLTDAIAPLDNVRAMRIAVVNVTGVDGALTVYAGECLSDVHETMEAVAAVLLVGIPVLTVFVAVLTWWAVGRTLRPVRTITRTMAEITASDLHRRVPVPAARDEVGQLAATVNDTLARLDTSVATQRRFVDDASHELRGPLAALRADLEISVTHPDRTEWTAVARDTVSDVERLQHLTDDLLLLARLDAPRQRQHERVDLAVVVGEAIRSIRRGDVVVAATGLDAAATVSGDADQLHRLMRNLVHNAEQHARRHVAVSVVADGDTIRVTVSDDGPGVPVAERAAVFERFTRLDTARNRDSGGTGLGLAIAADVAASHRGRIAIVDGELGGATFVVEVPRPEGSVAGLI